MIYASEGIVAENLWLKTQNDCFSLNALPDGHDFDPSGDPGECVGCSLSNIVSEGTSYGIMRTSSENGYPTRDHTVDNIVVRDVNKAAVRLGTEKGTNPEEQRNITLENWTLIGSTGNWFVELLDACQDITLENITWESGGLFTSAGYNCHDLTLENCHLRHTGGTSGLISLDANANGLTVHDSMVSWGGDASAGERGKGVGIESSTVENVTIDRLKCRGTDRGVVIDPDATVSDMRIDAQFTDVDYEWDDGNNTGSLGTTLGVTRHGIGEEAAGSGNSPTASNWHIGAEVVNTDDDTVWKLKPDGGWSQIG